MKCRKCFAENDDDSIFCANCGERLKENPNVEEQVQQNNNENMLREKALKRNKRVKNKKKLIFILGAIFVAFIGVITVSLILSNQPRLVQLTKQIEVNTTYDPVDLVEIESKNECCSIEVAENNIDNTTVSTGKITYKLVKSNDKYKEYTFQFDVVDTTPPTITSLDTILIEAGDEFDKSTITVTDNYDGEIDSANVTVSGNIYNDVEGTYPITLKVSDSSGNVASKTISVEVIPQLLYVGDSFTDDNLAYFKLKKFSFTKQVLPSNTSGYYSYYNNDNANNTYLDIVFAYKNLSTSSEEIDDQISAKLIYNNEYEYTGFIVLDAGFTFDQFFYIDPLEQNEKCHLIIDVPLEVSESSDSLRLKINTINDNTYLFQLR